MATRKPGYLDTTTNRNKRTSRYGNSGADNDVAYRLGTSDAPDEATADNKNRNRFS
jgi:hypothetical protein